jgi:hypothetical protein
MFDHIHLDAYVHAMQRAGLLIFAFVFVLAVARAFLTPKAQRSRFKSIPLQNDLKETPRAAKPPRQ